MVSNKKMSSKSKGKTIGTYLKLVDSLVKQSSYMHVNAGMILWKTRFLQIKLNNSACQCASKYYVLKILPTEHRLKQISKQKYLSICKDLHCRPEADLGMLEHQSAPSWTWQNHRTAYEIDTYSKPLKRKSLIQKSGFKTWNPYLTCLD